MPGALARVRIRTTKAAVQKYILDTHDRLRLSTYHPTNELVRDLRAMPSDGGMWDEVGDIDDDIAVGVAMLSMGWTLGKTRRADTLARMGRFILGSRGAGRVVYCESEVEL